MKDFKIDPATWDLVVENGDFVMVEDADEVAQRVAVALKTHRGEWLFDTDLGLPYREEIMVRNPDTERITGLIRALITGIEDVTGLTQLNLDYNGTQRTMQVTGTISTIYGPATFEAIL